VGEARWIHSARVDGALAFAWLPFALVAHAVAGDADLLATVLGATFLLSFLHQPITLPLVYGDPAQLAARRRLFLLSPIVFVVAISGGLLVSLTAVAVVAGLWNAEHTLMQRYGITRIYGRKAGQDDGGLEKAMLVSWLVLALVWVGADTHTPARVDALPLGDTNANGLHVLTDLRPWALALLVPVVLFVVALGARWLLAERARWQKGESNPAKLLYIGATAALFGWILLDPVAGFVGYVGAHAVEYLVIVHRSVGSRFADGSGGALGRVLRLPAGRRWFFGGYLSAFAVLVFAEKAYGSPEVYTFTVLLLGGLHVFYDGMIWKLRKPAVARGLVDVHAAASAAQPIAAVASA
jgi:hypothetical protein